MEEHPGQLPLYFGQQYDPDLTEEETYKRIEASQPIKTKKKLAEELKERSRGKRKGQRGLKTFIHKICIYLQNSFSGKVH